MSKQCFSNSLLLVASLLLSAATFDDALPEKSAKEPLAITANHMEAEQLGKKVTFTGNVTLKNEGMIISSDVMTVLYDVGSKAVEKVLAHGNVMVRKDGRVALSNDALYSSRDKTIVLTGDARIVENENQIGGEKITLFIADDRSIVEGRGKVMFYQDKTTENGKKE